MRKLLPAGPSEADDFWAKLLAANFGFAAAFTAAFILEQVLAGDFPYDRLHYLIGRDFVNVWTAGREAWGDHPSLYYDVLEYWRHLTAEHGRDFPLHNWSYPPHIFLLAAPFGTMAYLPALAAWSAAGCFVYLVAGLAGGFSWERLFLLGLAPVLFLNLYAGQNGFFTAALLIATVSLMDRRPLAAGICLGLLSFKPQLGLLFPLFLVLTRRWQVFLSASATVLAIVAVTVGLFGLEAWRDYLEKALPFQVEVLRDLSEIGPAMMPTAFMNGRVIGLDSFWCVLAQVPFSLLALWSVVQASRKDSDPEVAGLVLLGAVFVFSPYSFNYDMVVLTWVAVRARQLTGPSVWGDRLILAVWLLPVLGVIAGILSVPGSALVPAAFLLWLAHHCRPARRPASSGTAAPDEFASAAGARHGLT